MSGTGAGTDVRAGALAVSAAGIDFRNPLLLAAGTAGYGRELADVMDLSVLGGLVTKAVSLTPRAGAPAPRVADFDGGMINAVGLANPGVEAVGREHLPWLASHLPSVRTLVNVVGSGVEEFAEVVRQLETGTADAVAARGIDGYELNVSCPNVRAGGLEFGADHGSLSEVVRRARSATRRPLFVKLSPMLPDIAFTARVAADAGADGITVVNTMPGLIIDVERRRPMLGFGSGGVSGPAVRPVGVLAAWKVSRAVPLPVIGVGGVASAGDLLQYVLAGASLVAIGTAAMKDPRLPARILGDLRRWLDAHGIGSLAELRGTLEWPT